MSIFVGSDVLLGLPFQVVGRMFVMGEGERAVPGQSYQLPVKRRLECTEVTLAVSSTLPR